MSDAIGAAAAAAVAGFAAGALLSDAIKGAFASFQRRRAQRAEQVQEMRKVVMSVNPDWKGYTQEFEWTLVVGLTATVTVANHSDQLIRNVRVTMHRRPSGVDSGKMLPAVPPGESANVEIRRELGLDPEDRPFEEEEPGWLNLYWFEARFEDTRKQGWRLSYNPRDEVQTVEKDTA
jgi:hypothetical protein